VVVGGGVGIADHVEIGDRVRIAARSGVVGSWPDEATIGGYPSRNHRQWLRGQAALYRLAKIVEQLEALVEERSLRGTTND
jgi:UDP-3-O-[3-hydroxymyristoyl] glucosamine N-acyltransferase